ncbi:MAG: ABC transporter permease subunit [Lentisphaeraceae bacterium]|nr:ABC transporter permease subunit [Lentisphaeraceae bacterium]
MSFVVAGAIYFWLSYKQHQINPNDTTIPDFSQISEGFKEVFSKQSSLNPEEKWHGNVWFWQDSAATAGRFLLGILLGCLTSVILGVLMGCFAPIGAFFHPGVSFLAKVPPTAMLAVYFVVFGTEVEFFIAMIALGVLPVMTIAIFSSVEKDVSHNSIYKAYTLGASHGEVIWNVVYRQIFPRVLQNIQLAIGPAMVFLICAEWLVADVGFGYRLRMQSRLLNMNVVYVYLAFLGIAGLSLDYSLTLLRRKLCPWFGE